MTHVGQGGVASERDDVFQDEAGWYFWDITGRYFIGPHDSEDQARAALADYVARFAS